MNRVLGDAESCVPGRINHGPDLKIPKAESAGRMFFSRGTTTNYDRIIWLKSKVRNVLFVPSVAIKKRTVVIRRVLFTPATSTVICSASGS